MRKCVRKCLRTNNTTVVQENGLKGSALIHMREWVLISNLYHTNLQYIQFLDPKSTNNCNIDNNDALHSDRYSLR